VAVEDDAKARAVAGLDDGAEVVEEGFDLAPLDAGRRRLAEQRRPVRCGACCS